MPRSKLIMFKVSIVSLCLCSCVTAFSKIAVKVPNDFQMTTTEVRDKIPLTAGLYLKPDIRNYLLKGSFGLAGVSVFVGDALCVGSERMLKNIFRNVVIIDPVEGNLPTKNIDVIVTPELLGISSMPKKTENNNESWWHKPVVSQLTIKWNVVSLDGKNIYFNTIIGEIAPKTVLSQWVSVIEEVARENMIALLNDHFLKAQNDLYSNAWWKNQWWKDSKN